MVMALAALQAVSAAARDLVGPAIERGVRARLDSEAQLAIAVLRSAIEAGAVVTAAEPESGARFNRPARFRLLSGRRAVGYAVAEVTPTLPFVRARTVVPHGAVFDAATLEERVGNPGPVLMEPLPDLDAIAGAIAGRSCASGEVITRIHVRVPPAVRSGERVVAIARVGGAEVRGLATALQSGQVGDVIALVNVESRRRIRARVTAKAQVEVSNGSW